MREWENVFSSKLRGGMITMNWAENPRVIKSDRTVLLQFTSSTGRQVSLRVADIEKLCYPERDHILREWSEWIINQCRPKSDEKAPLVYQQYDA